MPVIEKAKETMSAKERVRKTFQMEKTDRVTIGYEANPGIHRRLCQRLGIPGENLELVYQALGVDYRGVPMKYVGPSLFQAPPGRRVDPVEGAVMRWVEHDTGGYWDFCDFPLKDADPEDFDNFPVPDPDDFDYDLAYDYAKEMQDYGIFLGSPGDPDIINSNGRLMGMEDVLCCLLTEDEAALRFIRKRAQMKLKVMERILDRCRGLIDFMWLGDDLGTQRGPMISLELFRKQIRPIHQMYVDLADAYGIPVMIHTCGSSSWAYEDFIEMGIRGVDTLQPEAWHMEPEYLKKHFGGRLCFRGCISTAGPLVWGTPAQVEETCRRTLEIMMDGYGYHFAPTHEIQDNTPVENVIAMYQTAHREGIYK